MPAIASLYRHPVKGLTPEPLQHATLEAGKYFPHDREYAVEVGPSGFDMENPGHISKQKFTVLARFPQLAQLRTQFNDANKSFHISDQSGFGVETNLATQEGREALERFLQAFLGEDAPGKLRVLSHPAHRFTDHPQGHVSLINLASVRALGRAAGVDVDPLRFRANIYVDGLPAWAEDGWPVGHEITAGSARLKLFKPIVRCIATHANPITGTRDLDTLGKLREHFGRDTLGDYFSVTQGGAVRAGDPLRS
jgi:uncharacterized protein